MNRKTVALAAGALAVVVAAGVGAVQATSAAVPPDLGPPIVAPAGGGAPAPADGGARPVPPQVAGDDRDVDDDRVPDLDDVFDAARLRGFRVAEPPARDEVPDVTEP
ncbi:hypothetical protein [Amycolatopsis sp. MtRt-6]|uniref:hypothetical protein n=1 Tax=Amycolatopsis sp. MtRt-6 TaxID=2792782 RepID=UPI001A901DAF|nr:hypothetical protein [Amycolatopsis sp. MtRt-6]